MRAERASRINPKISAATSRIGRKNVASMNFRPHFTFRVTPSTETTRTSSPISRAGSVGCASSARHSSEPTFTMPQSRWLMRLVTTPIFPTTASTFDAWSFTYNFAFSQRRNNAKYSTAKNAALINPTCHDCARRPIIPPAASDAPTSAKSNPVNAPSASSAATQSTPTITSSQFTQLPTRTPQGGHVQRTITLRKTRFNVSCEGSGKENSARTNLVRIDSPALAAFLPGFSFRRFPVSSRGKFAASFHRPAFFVDLVAARNTQRFRRNIFADCRARGDVRPITDFHRCDQHRIAADKNAIADPGLMFIYAIVVAGDGTRADVGLRSEPGIANIRKMWNFAAFADHCFFGFNEISDARTGFQMRAAAQSRKWPDRGSIFKTTLFDQRMRLHCDL